MAYKENINNCTKRECNVLSWKGGGFKTFLILLYSRISSTSMMGNLNSKLKTKDAEKNTLKTRSGKFTTSKKANVDFCLTQLNTKKIVTWKFHLDKSASGSYDMILGRYLPTTLGIYLKFSDDIIIFGEGPYKGCSAPMVDVSNYEFNIITAKIVKPE